MSDEEAPPKAAPAASTPPETEAALSLSRTEMDVDRDGPIKRATLLRTDTEGGGTPPGSDRHMDSYVGFTIDRRYAVEAVIARGGMGVVYRCRHRLIGKTVALKILRPDLADDREVTERFLREAQAASSIGNAHIVDVTDFGELPDGATYLVMEYLEGQSLRKLFAQVRPLPVDTILDLAAQIVEGLGAAHTSGIVHRDLKPDNLFVTTTDTDQHFLKILDFGIAKVASSQNKQTRAGKIFGTPHYMSPEQAAGDAVDQRTDIYSLGVILYEAAAGQVPFDGENPLGILTQHMYVAPVPLSERGEAAARIPAGLEAIILKCLSKDPKNRYGDVDELRQDLTAVAQGEVPKAVADLLARGDDNLPRDRFLNAAISANKAQDPPKNSATYAGLLLLMAGLAGVIVWRTGQSESGTAQARPAGVPALLAVDAGATAGGDEFRTVALVLSPIDAHVFRGDQDLGPMPISVKLKPGQSLNLEIRREGFLSRYIEVDGAEPAVMVSLDPIPGVSPRVPVPHIRDGGLRFLHADASPRVIQVDEPIGPLAPQEPVDNQPAAEAVPASGPAAPEQGDRARAGASDEPAAKVPSAAATAAPKPPPPLAPSTPAPPGAAKPPPAPSTPVAPPAPLAAPPDSAEATERNQANPGSED